MMRNCLLIILYVTSQQTADGAIDHMESRLINHLFTNYSKQARPVTHHTLSVNATFGIELLQIIKVDDRDQHVISKIWVRQSWTNMLMKWDPQNWGNLKSVQVDADMVWSPDIVLYNNADDEFTGGTEKYKTRITLEHTGKHSWLAPVTFKYTCQIDIRYFPFDKQVCFLKFGSWTYDKAGITLYEDPQPVITSQYIVSAQWQIIKVEKSVNSIKYKCCVEPYMDATFTLTLLRKPLYYVFNVIAPCIVLVSTILFGFFLPPESGERISLTMTILLAIAVFLQLVSDALPRNSDNIPILGMFYLVVMSESALSLITTCVVLVVHHRSSEKHAIPMPAWARKLFLEVLAKYLGTRASSKAACKHGVKHDADSEHSHQNGEIVIEREDKCHFNSDDVKSQKQLINEFFEKRPSSQYTNDLETHHILERMLAEQRKINSADDEKNGGTLERILSEIRMIRSMKRHKGNHEKIQAEWRSLAKVLDRLFFGVFLITITVSGSMILLPAYYINH